MSEPLRVAVVAEGPTDGIVIRAALAAILPDRPFVPVQLQPEGSLAFGSTGGGWSGVYRWCKQAVRRGSGRLSGDLLTLGRFDIVVIHLDADVAGKTYRSANLAPETGDRTLPCEVPCPPAASTCDALRAVLLSWCGESTTPARVVLCVPSKSTETWVVSTVFPNDKLARAACFECYPSPEERLKLQPKRLRFAKSQPEYQDQASAIQAAWARVATPDKLGQAHRFQEDLLAAAPVAEGSSE